MVLIKFKNKKGRSDHLTKVFDDMAMQLIADVVKKYRWTPKTLHEMWDQVVAEIKGLTK